MSQIQKSAEDEANNFPKHKTNFEKFLWIFSNITVEPTFFLTICTSMMYQVITQNLYLEKACRVDIGFNESICDAMTHRNTSGYTPTQEMDVQKLVSQMFAVRTTIQGFFPVCLILFVGSWTDRHCRRKPAIIFPIIGEILCCILLIINVLFFHELPIIFTTLGDCVPLALLGGWPCLFLGIYSFVATNSSEENRTLRVGSATACQIIGIVLGVGVSGFVYQQTGFLRFYILCVFTLVTALVFSAFLIKEPKTKSIRVTSGFFTDFFQVKNVANVFKVSFKKRPSNNRTKLMVLFILSATINGPIYGENNVSYLYTRYAFRWDYIEFGTFFSIQALLNIGGSMFALIIFSKILHCEDASLGILGLVGSIASSVVYALAPSSNYFYMGAIFDIFSVSSQVAVRSLMSKIVPPNELGQVNSLYGVVEALIPLAFGPLYSLMYRSTIDVFPSTYFLFSALLKFFGLCFFIYLFSEAVKNRKCPSITDVKDSLQKQQNLEIS